MELIAGTAIAFEEGDRATADMWARVMADVFGTLAPPPEFLIALQEVDSGFDLMGYIAEALVATIPFPDNPGLEAVALARRVIASFLARSRGQRPVDVIPLDPNRPCRGSSRGEIEMAKRLGWPETERHTIYRRVRQAAVAANNEAQFIRLCLEAGVSLYPRKHSTEPSVVGCSYGLAAPHPGGGRCYAGRHLAGDLSMPSLRESWTGDPTPTAAVTTWAKLVNPYVLQTAPSCGDHEGGIAEPWVWVHHATSSGGVDEIDATVAERWPPGSTPPRAVVWDVLMRRQHGICALCSIRTFYWRETFASTPARRPEPDHVDHDHATGLVRGLLCVSCNTVREPSGATAGDDVVLAYEANPPALPFGWRYQNQSST
ncbi:endonuclease domain-containing protein [Nocardia sp. bgisy118]|uniref:endonuclease domain-containing protein n=1 Tax=Nocardia sp. bgisy118 TaxID=3413786 RepID=UPI003F4A6CB3